MDLDTVADELYGLPRERFTAVRNERASEARKAGDRELASAIQQLRRPTLSAWLANLLSRRRPDEVAKLLELGTALRSAQDELEADALRELSPQRHRVVAALRRHAEELAGESGQAVSEAAGRELEETLEAALVDGDAGRSLEEGRLTSPLHYAGLGGALGGADTDVPEKTGVAASRAAAPRPAGRTGSRAAKRADDRDGRRAKERLREAEVAVREAQRRVRDASRHSDSAQAKAERARRRLEEHDSQRRALEEQLEDAERAAQEQRAEHAQQERSLAVAEAEREAAFREAERDRG